MADRFSDTLASLAGARADILEVVSGARTRFVAMGAALLTTAAIASLSAGFAVRMALDAPVGVAAAIGAGWGVVILVIDRALVVGMGQHPSLLRNLGIAAPRVVLALILGTVISTPITLQIFHHEIDTEIHTIHREAADTFSQSLANDARFSVIPQLQQQVEDAKARVVSDGGTDPAVKDKQAAYDAAFAKYQELQAAAQCELNGTCGTQRAGVGDAYDSARLAAERQLAVVDAARADLEAASARSKSQAQSDLDAVQSRLSGLLKTRQDLQDSFDARNADDTGLLIRLEALERIGSQHAMLGWAHRLLWLMFTCIELLPLLIKLLMNLGGSSAYDRVQQAQDSGDADVFEEQLGAWKDVQRERARLGVDLEHDRLSREKAQGLAINEKVIMQQTKVVEAALAIWARHAEFQAAEQLAEYERQLAAEGPGGSAVHLHTDPATGPRPAEGNPISPYEHPSRNGHSTHNAANAYLRAAALPDGGLL